MAKLRNYWQEKRKSELVTNPRARETQAYRVIIASALQNILAITMRSTDGGERPSESGGIGTTERKRELTGDRVVAQSETVRFSQLRLPRL